MQRYSWLIAFLGSLACLGQELPEPVIPAGMGVNIHFVTGHEQDLDLIAGAGFKFIRMDFGWAAIEKAKGQYSWDEYEELLRNLDQRGIRAVFILDYSNPLYEPEVTGTNPLTHALHRTISSPQHPESVAAYAAWAAASAKHFQGRHVLWELWNEPNIDFWSPKPDANQYTALALAAGKAIRTADPRATIAGPASSGFPWQFLGTFLESGVLQYLDAVSVHPYREPRRSPETAAADYERLKGLVDGYAPAEKKGKIPILSGEWGYSSWHRGVSPQTQADFAVRQQLFNLLNGVPLSIWYDWKNDGTDEKENEHNFGTVLPDLRPKPAYLALKTLAHELGGYRIVRRLPLESSSDYVLVCAKASGAEKLVAWTTSDLHSVTIPFEGDARGSTGALGDGTKVTPILEKNHFTVDLSASPQYLGLGSAKAK